MRKLYKSVNGSTYDLRDLNKLVTGTCAFGMVSRDSQLIGFPARKNRFPSAGSFTCVSETKIKLDNVKEGVNP